MIAVLVALAGGLGAATRYAVDRLATRALPGDFPVGTVLVNVTGSLLLGLLTGTLADRPGSLLLAVGGTGFCGGYTTFGTAMVEALRLYERRERLRAAAHHLGTCLLCLAAAALGLQLGA